MYATTPLLVRIYAMKEPVSTAEGQPYEPFAFARRHRMSVALARRIIDQFGAIDRLGPDAAVEKVVAAMMASTRE